MALMMRTLFACLACAASASPLAAAGQPMLRFRGGAAPPSTVVTLRPEAQKAQKTMLVAAADVELPTAVKLFIGSVGIFLSFSVFAVLQEDVYKKAYGGEFFASTFFALLIERGLNALVALCGVAT